jgi:hypothetical protein
MIYLLNGLLTAMAVAAALVFLGMLVVPLVLIAVAVALVKVARS